MFRSSLVSVQGASLRVFVVGQAPTAVVVAVQGDVATFVGLEEGALLLQLRAADLSPSEYGLLDRAAISYALLQRFPTKWAEICAGLDALIEVDDDYDVPLSVVAMARSIARSQSASRAPPASALVVESDSGDDDDDGSLVTTKSRRVDSADDNDDLQSSYASPSEGDDIVTEPPLIITTPKSFSRQQYTKQYSLRDYDISPALQGELDALREWWTKPFNAMRQSDPISSVTFTKRRERILCFFGFLVQFRCVARDLLSLRIYSDWRAFESYICYLKEVRMISSASVAEAITGAVFVAKWLHREVENPGRNFADVVLVQRYRDWRNQQASMAIRERKAETWDDLRDRGKWLHWAEYCEAVADMRAKFDAFGGVVSLKSAKTLHDALLLLLFQVLPARSGEVRLLEFIPEEEVRAAMAASGKQLSFRQFVEREKINLLTSRDGKWTMFLACYKNYRHNGVDVTEFDAVQHRDLIELLNLWLLTYRTQMVAGIATQHRFIFVTKGGKPFGESYFSEYLARLICNLTGQKVAANLLRSSFISYFYGRDEGGAEESYAVRDSVARVMRHSVREAERTYDRRTVVEKKRKGMEVMSLLVE